MKAGQQLVKATNSFLRGINHPYSKAFIKELRETPTEGVALYILEELADTSVNFFNSKQLEQIALILDGYRKGHIPKHLK
jgi:hypothetical protein